MVRHGRQAHSLPVTLRAYVQQALFYQAVGPFHRCAEICAQGIEMAERAWSEHTVPAPPAELVAHLEGLLALMLLLWHRIEEAEVHARRAVALFELGGSQVGHHIEAGLLNLAWAHCARGEDANAYAVLRHCDRLLQGCSQPVNRQVKPKLVRLRIGLAHARPEWRHLMRDVESWVHECRLDPEHLEKNQVRDYEAYGCGLMAIGRAAEAIPWLERGLNKTQEQGWVLSEMLFAIWLAVAHDQVGNAKQAVETMANALALAEPGGWLQIFLEYGPLALVLLRRIRAMLPHRAPPFSQITPEFVDSVLVLFPERAVAAAPEPPTAPVTQPLIEPLSERELDVLHLVACGLRNQEIADRLYVTINTVGFHLKNIYGKLDVHSRSEAIVTAHALGLIPWTHTPGH